MTRVEEDEAAAKYIFTADGIHFGTLLMHKKSGEADLLEPLKGDDRRDYFLRASAKLRKEWKKGSCPEFAEWVS